MDLSGLLNGAMGQSIVKNVAGQLGLDEKQASSAVNTAIPVILGGLSKNAQTTEGAESLNKALDSKHNGSLLDNLGGALGGGGLEGLLQDGGGILGHVFGNNVAAVENGVAQKTGVSVDKVGPLIKMLAPIVMAYLGKEKSENKVDSGGLSSLLGGILGASSASNKKSGGLFGMVSGLFDKNKNGNPIDDILGMLTNKK